VTDPVAFDVAFELALLDAVDAAVVATDLSGRILRWNKAAERLYGFTAEQMQTAGVMELFVGADDRERAAEIMQEVLAGRSWSGDFSVRTADGAARLVQITDSPVVVDGTVVGVVGVAYDVSDLRFDQARAADREGQLRQALAAGELGTWRWDVTTGRTSWDEQLERIFGLPPGGFDGSFETYVGLLHPDDRDDVLSAVSRAVEQRSSYEFRHRALWPDGQVKWLECRGHVSLDAHGAVTGTTGCSWDVTDRVRTELALERSLTQARAATGRLHRLQQMTADLAAASDVDGITDTVRDHVREAFHAAAGAIALPDQRRRAVTMTAAYGDEAQARQLFGPWSVDSLDLPVTSVARTGRSLYLSSAQEMADRFPAVRPLLASSTAQGVACEPFAVADGDLFGVLVATCAEPRQWTDEDRALLTAMARQCGVALERSRLHEDSRRVAERLQTGLLPRSLPRVPGLDVGAVYQPGGEATEQLGGDWYDVLPQDDGRISLVIGDVMGRGIDAAATMARLSTAVRAFASVDPDPASVLRRADRFARQEAPEEFVTLLYAVIDRAHGSVSVASAGHLPLIVVNAREVSVLHQADCPPVGLAEEARPVRTAALAHGDALVLTTDGLIERPGIDLDEALRELGAQAQRLLSDGRAVPDVARALVEQAVPLDRQDDMTVLVARLTDG
jgi:PAS domain S-box-containing protein